MLGHGIAAWLQRSRMSHFLCSDTLLIQREVGRAAIERLQR
jgi:hypothetical protein